MQRKQKKEFDTDERKEKFEALFRNNYAQMLFLSELLFKKNGLSEAVAKERAQDALQEAMTIAWEKWQAVATHPNPEGWLYQTVRYRTLKIVSDEWTWRKRMVQLNVHQEENADAACVTFSLREKLTTLMAEEEFRLLYRLYVEGCTYQELSKGMGISKDALMMRVSRLKARLRKEL